ncbi:MAG: hypothetical protein KAG18_08585 [Sinobacterium sp.]|nr:hypothetical protein [Sinobacterium sp.]
MSDIHIQDFYKDIGITLSKLYATFPRKVTTYVEDICGSDQVDEYGLHSERYLSALSGIVWLKDQGYIDYESLVKQEAVDFAVLTEKSFLILTSQAVINLPDAMQESLELDSLSPYALQKALSNISLLRTALKSRSSINIERVVFHLLEQGSLKK